jgi:hypothetical protein
VAQDLTKKKVSDFLHAHSAYELIPESGKVVLLDLDLPIRQAFHALHEQVGAAAGGGSSSSSSCASANADWLCMPRCKWANRGSCASRASVSAAGL